MCIPKTKALTYRVHNIEPSSDIDINDDDDDDDENDDDDD